MIYICIKNESSIYYTDYKTINWQKLNIIDNKYIGIVQKQDDNNIFIAFTINQLYLTKDGGKIFKSLLMNGLNYNGYKIDVSISSDNKIYFSFFDRIYVNQL